jgi:hypothetical protein
MVVATLYVKGLTTMNRFYATYRFALLYVLSFLTVHLFAQTPTHYPTGQQKVDFNVVNILIYIVFPVLLVVIWILIRRRKQRD